MGTDLFDIAAKPYRFLDHFLNLLFNLLFNLLLDYFLEFFLDAVTSASHDLALAWHPVLSLSSPLSLFPFSL